MPSPPTSPRRRFAASAALASACAVALATFGGALSGCGSSNSSGTDADPAGAVPAAAVVYAGATVRPAGSEKQAAQAAGQALTHERDPYLRLLGVLQTPGSPPLNFQRDVAPWLGPHAGVFLSSLGSSSSLTTSLTQGLLHGSAPGSYPFGSAGAQGAIVLDTSDSARASSFLNTQARRAGAHAASYRGISYQATAAGLAFGLVERFAVIGSEAGLHSVIDTTLGAGALAHQGGYAKLLAKAPSGALAHVYVNPTSSTEPAGASSKHAGAPGGLSGLLRLLAGTREANISLVPSASSLAIDADTLAAGAGGGGLLSADPEGARALDELPGESWLAIGLGNVGANLPQDVGALQSLASLGSLLGGSSAEGSTSGTTFGLRSLVDGLTVPLSVLGAGTAQAKRDFTSWMGSGGIFASGAGLLELKAAVVIESKDPALSRAAVNKLGAQLHKTGVPVSPVSIPGANAAIGVRLAGVPLVLAIANGIDSSGHAKFVLGLGEASVQNALAPPNTLANATSRSAAAAALGEGTPPSLIVDFPTLLGLLEGVGLTTAPEIAPVLPYLRAATTLAGGGRSLGGEVERFRLVLGLQPPTG